MTGAIPRIFDAARLRQNRDRAAHGDPSHRFLADWAMRQIADRLRIITRSFPTALQIGALTGADMAAPLAEAAGVEKLIAIDPAFHALGHSSSVQAMPDVLPFADHSFDLVFSPFVLHTINDLPGAFAQIKRVLKPDGLFLAAFPGGDSLTELRGCIMDAEIAVRGGASARVYPFLDKQQAGALLQRAGYALPVVDSETLTVTYTDAFRLMRDVRMMGEGNMLADRDRRFAGRMLFMETARLYAERYSEPDGRIPATFEIIFVHGWSPHASQQQPARRGSATVSMADVL